MTPSPPGPEDSSSPSVSESLQGLNDEELTASRRLGQLWLDVPGMRHPRLPVDPSLERSEDIPTPSRFGRFAPISMFKFEGAREIVASEEAESVTFDSIRALHRLRRIVLGPCVRAANLKRSAPLTPPNQSARVSPVWCCGGLFSSLH